MIGSRRKWRLISRQFLDEQIATDEQLSKVACPVGLDIRPVSVPEIALSVMAQFVQKRAELTARGVSVQAPAVAVAAASCD